MRALYTLLFYVIVFTIFAAILCYLLNKWEKDK